MSNELVKLPYDRVVRREPLDLLFVGSTNDYKERAVTGLRSKQVMVSNISSAYVDLYPNDEPISQPEGCYFARAGSDTKTRFFGEPISADHHLLIFFKKIQYGREFGAICSCLNSDFFNKRLERVPPYNFAAVHKLLSPDDELPNQPEFFNSFYLLTYDGFSFGLNLIQSFEQEPISSAPSQWRAC